jgi:nucleoside-diphosphate kinase
VRRACPGAGEDSNVERTLTIIKPDSMEKNVAGKILARLEEEGFRIVAMRLVRMGPGEAGGFYVVHRERPFYQDLCSFMSSGPAIPVALERENAIAHLRAVMGATDPAKAEPGTIRAEFGTNIERNAIHGSDAPETAAFEMGFFFCGLETVA